MLTYWQHTGDFLKEICVSDSIRNAWNRRTPFEIWSPYVLLSCQLDEEIGMHPQYISFSLFDHKFVHPFVKSAAWGIVAMVTIRWDATRWATRWAAIITTRWITTRWARWATIRWLAIRWAVARFGLPSSEPLHSPWKIKCFGFTRTQRHHWKEWHF